MILDHQRTIQNAVKANANLIEAFRLGDKMLSGANALLAYANLLPIVMRFPLQPHSEGGESQEGTAIVTIVVADL